MTCENAGIPSCIIAGVASFGARKVRWYPRSTYTSLFSPHTRLAHDIPSKSLKNIEKFSFEILGSRIINTELPELDFACSNPAKPRSDNKREKSKRIASVSIHVARTTMMSNLWALF